MANAFRGIGHFLFGSGQQTQTPTIINEPAPTPPPIQSPTGNAGTNKAQSGPSFLSGASTAPPSQGNQGGKSLLGQ